MKEGHHPEPSAAIIDSQSVKKSEGGEECGFDAGKKVTGRKRHLLVDTLGLLIAVVVHSASVQDRDGARRLMKRAGLEDRERLQLVWADAAYAGELVEWADEEYGLVLEIVRGEAGQKGFVVQPRRWVVERTFAWLMLHRRLARDYERLTAHSEAFIYVAMTGLMLNRIFP